MTSIEKTKYKVNPDLVSEDEEEYKTLSKPYSLGVARGCGASWCKCCNKKWPSLKEVYATKKWNEETPLVDKIKDSLKRRYGQE